MDHSDERRKHLEELVRESEEAGLYDLPPILGSENLAPETFEALGHYCHRGWYVFPCKPGGKEPVGSVCPRGWKDATSDWPRALDMFFRAAHQTGGSPNIGIACEPSGLVVLDIDPRNGGSFAICEEFFRRVGVDQGVLKKCPTVATGGQGWHLYFRYEGQAPPQATIAQGVERKSRGVYVIAPPSVHPSGTPYRWVTNGLPDLIPQAVASAPSLSSGSKNDTLGGIGDNIIPEGQRNDHAFRLLSAARARGVGREGLLALVRAVNAKQYKPPLSDVELERTVDSVLRYPAGQPIMVAQTPQIEGRWFEDIEAQPVDFPTPLVAGLLAKEAINMIAGGPGSGKSMIALDMAVSLAAREPVLGHHYFLVPDAMKVAYVYGEQSPCTWELRVRAIAKHRNLRDPLRGKRLCLIDGTRGGKMLKLTRDEDLKTLISYLKANNIGVVFLDPMSFLLHVNDENDAAVVAEKIRPPLYELCHENITPVVVHHSTKEAAQGSEPRRAHQLVRGSGDYQAMLGALIGVWLKDSDKEVKVMPWLRDWGGDQKPFRTALSEPVDVHEGDTKDVLTAALETSISRVAVYAGFWDESGKQGLDFEGFLAELPEEFRTREASDVWNLSRGGALERLNKMAKKGLVKEIREGLRSDWRWVKCSPAPSDDAEEEDEG